MSTLSLGEARAHIETDLNDDALQLLIDDAEAEITEQVGALASQVDIFTNEESSMQFFYARETDGLYVFLARKASSISSIVEKVRWGAGYLTQTLAADDYLLRENNRVIERLASGTNPRTMWGNVVTVTYVPQDDTIRRKAVTIDIVKLEIAYNGVQSERVGNYSSSSKDHMLERNQLIQRLRSWSFA